MKILQKLETELPHHTAILVLDIYPEKMKTLIQKGTYTPVFIAALFKIGKVWRWTKCLSTDEWMNTHTHTHTQTHTEEHYSAINNKILLFAAMSTEGILVSEISHRERKTLYNSYVKSKK